MEKYQGKGVYGAIAIGKISVYKRNDIKVKRIKNEDSRGNYYIGCFLGGGLIKYNPTTKDYKVYNNVKDDENSLSNNM